MKDQDGLRAVVAATAGLADDAYPPEGVHHGDYHRLHVGEYRVVYVIDPDRLTIERVDRVN